jgi:hypothetical protein
VKDGNVGGILLAEPRGVPEVLRLNRQRSDDFSQVINEQVSDFGGFLGLNSG